MIKRHRLDPAAHQRDIERFAERSIIEARRETLYQRLEEGYQRIEKGIDQCENVETWESLWLALLNEYESVTEQLQRDLAV